jgi:hypothetical protein
MRAPGAAARAAAIAAACLILIGGFGGSRAEESGWTLLDAPRGAWLGELRRDAPLQVIEERDGWRRVRVEGWVRATPSSPGTPGSAPGVTGASSAPGPPAAVPGAAAQGASGVLHGLLSPKPGMEPATAGGGLVVLVLPDPKKTDADHKALGEPCRALLADLDRRVADLNDQVQASLNSSSNFKEAAQRNDRAKAALQSAQRERSEKLTHCREQAEAFFSERAVARTVSDAAGRFEIGGLAPGRYRVVAMERTATTTRGWSMSAEAGDGMAPLEGRAADGPDPYWDLR